MKVSTHRQYDKAWKKLSRAQRRQAIAALTLFLANPKADSLRLHQLKGKYHPQYSISAGGDLRIHFLQTSPETIQLMLIGTHSQLYG